ncbi:hypothetical protein BHM03_00049548, partial [Ensete ventricosum]
LSFFDSRPYNLAFKASTTASHTYAYKKELHCYWREQNWYGIVEDENNAVGKNQQAMAAENNTLLRVLDGQKCRLDAKYGRVFLNKRNVPVITITNKPPRSIRIKGPFHERFIRLRFKSVVKRLQKNRVIATLYGCIMRRLQQKGVTWEEAKNVAIAYNQEDVLIRFMIPMSEQDTRASQRQNAKRIERALREGDCGLLEADGKRYAKLYVEHKHQPEGFAIDGHGEIMHLAVQYTIQELQGAGGKREIEPGQQERQTAHLTRLCVRAPGKPNRGTKKGDTRQRGAVDHFEPAQGAMEALLLWNAPQ